MKLRSVKEMCILMRDELSFQGSSEETSSKANLISDMLNEIVEKLERQR